MATIGVKVNLEGAQAYKKGMAECTQETKLYQAETKKLQTEIKNGNTSYSKRIELGKALQNTLNAQKKQEALLQAEIERVAQAEGENSEKVLKLKTQYENLQNAIARTEQSIKDNGGSLEAIGQQFDALGSKIGAVGEKISAFGEGLTKNVTAPIVAVGSASLVAFNEVDGALDTVIKKTGASGQALEDMEGIVNDIATSIPTSFDKVGNAVGEVNTRFGVTGEELKDLSTKFIEFSELNGTDVSNSIDAVQSAMASFGLSTSDTALFLDTLNKAGQDTGISVDTLAQAMTTNASALKEMGYSASDSAFFIANLSKQGLDANSVMAGMKKALANATSEGKTMEEAMSELQDTMINASSDTEAYQKAIELFGSKSGIAIAEACQSGRLSFEALNTSMEDFSGNVEDTFNATLDPVDEFQTNMNKLKILGTDIANSMMPTITKVMEKFGNTIQKVSDAWNGLSEGQQEAIIKIAGIVALVGPVLVGIGKFITLIGSVISSIGTITTLISGLVPVIGGIGGVITATVIPAIGGVITALAPFLPIILAVAGAIAGIIVVIKNWGAITDWIQEKWQIMTEFLSTGIDGLQAYLTEHFGIIGQVISTYIEYFKTVITTAVEVIRTVIQTVVEVVKALISGNFDQVGIIVQNGLTKIKTTISTAINYVLSIVKTVLNNIKTAISTGITSVVNKIKTMGTTIKSTFLDLKDSALTWGKDLIQNFIDGIKAKIEALKDTVRGVAQTVRDFLGFSEPKAGPLSNFHTYGPDMMQNYAEGIKNAKYLVEQAVSDVAMDVNALLNDPIDYDKVYEAIRQGASDSTTKIILNNREVTRGLAGMGVVFNG